MDADILFYESLEKPCIVVDGLILRALCNLASPKNKTGGVVASERKKEAYKFWWNGSSYVADMYKEEIQKA